ncbi:MAG: hypothetical protein QOJ32_2400 [Frankiaceae bacterium]|nr:hypothetical protein [Frankiaceae bacterium]
MSPDTTSLSTTRRTVLKLATRPVADALGALARLRSGPAVHAVGTSYAATLEVIGAEASARALGLPFVDEPGQYSATVRLSRAAGLPAPAPDVLGLAIRVDPDGQAEPPQDLLLDSCWPGPVGRHLIRPARAVDSGWYGSLLAYRAGDAVIHLAARGEGAQHGPLNHDSATGCRFRLLYATPRAQEWTEWATLTVQHPVERPELRFSPANDGRGIRLRVDWLRFRIPSYRTSQEQGPGGRRQPPVTLASGTVGVGAVTSTGALKSP